MRFVSALLPKCGRNEELFFFTPSGIKKTLSDNGKGLMEVIFNSAR